MITRYGAKILNYATKAPWLTRQTSKKLRCLTSGWGMSWLQNRPQSRSLPPEKEYKLHSEKELGRNENIGTGICVSFNWFQNFHLFQTLLTEKNSRKVWWGRAGIILCMKWLLWWIAEKKKKKPNIKYLILCKFFSFQFENVMCF